MKFLSVKMLWIVTTGLVGGVLLMLLMHRDQTGTRTPVPGQAVPRSFEAPVEKDRASAIMVRDMDFTLRNMQGQNPSAPAEAVNLTSTNIVDFEGIYFRNPLVSLHVDSQKCFVVTE